MTLAGVLVAGGLAGGFAVYGVLAARTGRRQKQVRERSQRLGGAHREPVSLHPKIDEHKCICTGACVTVCPEKDVLGMVNGRPELLNPAACIGHGECMRACPVEAITLVIGSERRGVDLPLLGTDFQTNMPGLFIAGELGGMGLIHNAVNQGVQAMRAIAASLKDAPRSTGARQVLIVGAGPAGMAAALQAKALGLDFAVLEQDRVGGALRSYPRQKIVMTAPVHLPLHGSVKLRRTTKEALLELWEKILQQTAIPIESKVRVGDIRRDETGVFTLETSAGPRRAQRVLLAIGRRGTPRKLDVPGEDLPKVTYQLIEPEQYRGSRCLVVGGGDSAVEAALALSREPDTHVTLAYRGERFDRIKPDNHDALLAARDAGRLTLRTATQPAEIGAAEVVLKGSGTPERLPNDYVFVCIGGEVPTAWLNQIGIEVRTLRGEAHPALQR